jgi:gluconokinase
MSIHSLAGFAGIVVRFCHVVIIIMGVSGSGKSTIGKALAARLGWKFYEGDDYHPAENIEKMSSGLPLNDADRAPWLARLAELIHKSLQTNDQAVLTCSALKRSYRRQLMLDERGVRLVYLAGSQKLILERIEARVGHFMTAGLLRSQFRDLELPEDAVCVDINQSPDAIVGEIIDKLDLPGGPAASRNGD